jgi:phage terminase large subunit
MCSWSAALPGAYYAKVVDKLERDGGIGRVPYNPARQVHTAWDLGANDMTVIWFMQRTPGGWAVIDYIANTSSGIDWYVREILAALHLRRAPVAARRRQPALGLPEAASIADTAASWG